MMNIHDIVKFFTHQKATGRDFDLENIRVQTVDPLKVLANGLSRGCIRAFAAGRKNKPPKNHKIKDAGDHQCYTHGRYIKQPEGLHLLTLGQGCVRGGDQIIQQDQG